MIYRGVLQLVIGVAIPAALDMFLVGIYLNAIGQDIRTNGFLQFDFPVIVFLLIALNSLYIVIPMLQRPAAIRISLSSRRHIWPISSANMSPKTALQTYQLTTSKQDLATKMPSKPL